MAPTPHRCQQFSATRRRAARRLTALALSIAVCLGCWQEVRYEPGKTDASTPATSNQTKAAPAVAVAEPLTRAALPAAVDPPESAARETVLLETVPPATVPPATVPPARVSSATASPAEGDAIRPAGNSPALSGRSEPFAQTLSVVAAEQAKPQTPAKRLQETPVSQPISSPQSPAILPPQEETAAVAEETAEDLSASPAAARTALLTWQMSSKWSMAAALQAKGRNADSFGERQQQARQGAQQLGVSLAELPAHAAGADRLPTNLAFLLDTAGPRLASELAERHGAEQAALAELATKTHVLLLSYTPSSTRLEPIVAAIRRAAVQSALPESVWGELVDLLQARAEFDEVKAAIFQLHRRAVAHLSGTTSP